ncbi:50S ribosomal chloroplastic [Micractinium conductrix]|uniref:50S ribosomal chloroplastic n=1 Tax=Micractinium conductrix TaxID=554055 RepID=A0A2P6VDN3_9CHLO|nr:50S ribosomal chloroplastic [Micractinium conductrix]|eukprot:PSC72171.1 50S ribosomal chloroplastic [Micractinium conductrix]
MLSATLAGPTTSRMVTTCATHPQFKGAKKMAHRRPKKRCPADRRHGPAQYPAPPAPPAEYTVISQ